MWGKETKNSDFDPVKEYDQEISVNKAGKKIVWKEYIEAANEDVEPYKVFEKYGSIEKIKVDVETIHGDFTEYNDLRTNLDREIKAKQMWENLPYTVRKEFGNDINNFRDEGQEWINQKYKKLQEERAAQERQIAKVQEYQKQIIKNEVAKEIDNGNKS